MNEQILAVQRMQDLPSAPTSMRLRRISIAKTDLWIMSLLCLCIRKADEFRGDNSAARSFQY